jgi:hypothetical protein
MKTKSVKKLTGVDIDVWEGMLLFLKDSILYIFAVLFALGIALIIYFLVDVTIEKLTAFYVNWKKSREWCEKVADGFEKNQSEISELKDSQRSDKNDRERIDNNRNVIYRELKELRDFIGIDAQKAQADAEKAIEESVQ